MASSARPRGRQVNVLQALALLLAFLLVAGIGGVLAAGLVLPAAASVSAVTNGTAQVFEDLPTVLNETPLSGSAHAYWKWAPECPNVPGDECLPNPPARSWCLPSSPARHSPSVRLTGTPIIGSGNSKERFFTRSG